MYVDVVSGLDILARELAKVDFIEHDRVGFVQPEQPHGTSYDADDEENLPFSTGDPS